MADDKSKRGKRDQVQVSAGEEYEIRYLMEQGNVSRDEALRLIHKHGGNRAKIMQELAAR